MTPHRTLLSVAVAVAGVFTLLAACGSDGTSATDTAANTTAAGDTAAPASTAGTDAPTTTVVATTAAPISTEPAMAHLRGTAYTFNTSDPIAGATILVEEYPDVSATTAADGSYELALPAGATATAYIVAEGHHTIHVQTFTLDDDHDGTELDGVNFQTPTDGVYDGLKALIESYVGRNPFEGGCVIVTTVGDSRMVGMPFDEFIDFHPHGVAGATALIEPPLATPIYFNDGVVPDPAQLVTSGDGGVLWPNVPPGEYTLSAQHPTEQFVTVRARCEEGWVVNANPVWGLHAVP